MTAEAMSAAMRASLGHVRLRALDRSPRFADPAGDGVGYADIHPPGAVIGRAGGDADLWVQDDSGYVSRVHVLVQPLGLQWVIRDCGSIGGTRIVAPGHRRIDLPRDAPWPLVDGTEIALADVAWFTAEIVRAQPSGERTREPDGSLRRPAAILADDELLKVADALLRPRREQPGSARVPSAQDLAQELSYSERTIYNRLERLAGMDAVARHLGKERRIADIADAVMHAFPYLAVPRRDIHS